MLHVCVALAILKISLWGLFASWLRVSIYSSVIVGDEDDDLEGDADADVYHVDQDEGHFGINLLETEIQE